jgi:hypothetical protein
MRMMSKVSDAAKAAAVMHYVLDFNETALTPELAVEIFDALGTSHGPVQDVLDKFDMTTEHFVHMDVDDGTWWESLELLALNIDAMFDHFEFPARQI